LQIASLEEKGGDSVSSFASTVMSDCVSGNMTRTDKDRTEIDSQLQVSFCYPNSVVLHFFLANDGKVEQQVSPFG
jgi:hypothetical protein